MKGVLWQNGQRIIRQVLDWFSTSKDEIDQEYRQDYTQPGIVYDALDEFEIEVGDNNAPPTTHSINVKAGVAHDSLGQRVALIDDTLSYDATNPSDTTDDGLGNPIPTPHSTGSKNIPLTANSFNYVWIDYLLITDETQFTLQRATNAKQFYKQDDGYQITVTTTFTPPTATSVYLGSVNLTGFGVVSGSTISTANRNFTLIREKRVKIRTPLANLSDATTTYGFDQDLTLDEHIKAVGSGAVTPQNPHGMTLGDIGVDVETVVANHQKFMHSNGMIGSRTTLLSSLYLEFHPITPGDDFIIIKPLLATEVVNIDGITITSSDVPTDTTFLFSPSGDAGGTYYIYLDKFTKSLIRTTINPIGDVTKFPVASMLWTPGFTPLFDGNLTSIVDLRVFGTINNDKIDNKDTYDLFRVSLENGTVAAPSLAWQSDLDTGIYLSGSGVLSFTSNGVLSVNISGGQVSAVNGSASLPAYAFLNDTNTGLFSQADDILRVTTGGTERFDISSQIVSTSDGSASSPTYSFTSESNTGMFKNGTSLAFSRAGTQILSLSTSGGMELWSGSFQISSGGRIFNSDGTSASPSYSFLGAGSNYGMYRSGSTLGFSIAGLSFLTLNSTQTFLASPIRVSGLIDTDDFGTVSDPGYGFTFDANTGIYRSASGELSIASGGSRSASFAANLSAIYTSGTNRFQVDTTSITKTLPIYGESGSTAAPTYSFTGDTNTGMYRVGSDNIGFAVNGSKYLDITSSRISATNQFQAGDGTSGGYFFNTAGNATGVYYSPPAGINALILRAQGLDQINIGGSPNRIDVWNNMNVRAAGTASTCSLSIGNSFGTGFYPGGGVDTNIAAGGVTIANMNTSGIRFEQDAWANDNARIWAQNNTSNSGGVAGTGIGLYTGNGRFGSASFDVNGNVGEAGMFSFITYRDDGTGSHMRTCLITTSSGTGSITVIHDVASGADPGTAVPSISINGGGSGIHRITYAGPTSGPCLGYYQRWH